MSRLASAARRNEKAVRLSEVVAAARRDSVEFPPFMANHLPMILVALDRLGADTARLEAYAGAYRKANGLVSINIPERGRIGRGNWRDHFGERAFEADYRAFFAGEVARLGSTQAQALYLPQLAPGVAASALHALMRLAYANLSGDPEEVATGLAYWACAYLPLGTPSAQAQRTEEPLEILLGLRSRMEEGPPAKPETDLLWHWMRAVAALPAFAPVPGALVVTSQTMERLRRASLALFASTMTFEALHAVTGCHWLRLIAPTCPDMPTVITGFWTAIAAVYPKIGMPLPLEEASLEAMRRSPHVPDWEEIAAVAAKRDDEHDISLAFSAREECALTGDQLYQVVAAKRLGLA
ncbi:MAG: questin oxidase family protein [Methylobacteriaceae bacterium]|nr:questin oxidase family protein [Methylobacteriaceae bacterium]